MAQDESKNLQKYFEDDPPSFFDDLASKEGEFSSSFVEFRAITAIISEVIKVSAEVRDLWPYPSKGDKFTPTVPLVTVEALVG